MEIVVVRFVKCKELWRECCLYTTHTLCKAKYNSHGSFQHNIPSLPSKKRWKTITFSHNFSMHVDRTVVFLGKIFKQFEFLDPQLLTVRGLFQLWFLTLAVCVIIDLKTSSQSKIQNTFFHYNEKKNQRMSLNFAHVTGKNQSQVKISFVS